MPEADRLRHDAEAAPGAKLSGAQHSTISTKEFFEMMDRLAHRFEPHPINQAFLAIIQSGKAAPDIPRYLGRAVERALVSLRRGSCATSLGWNPSMNSARLTAW
jgi:uncharacterized protein (DUF2236 family)